MQMPRVASVSDSAVLGSVRVQHGQWVHNDALSSEIGLMIQEVSNNPGLLEENDSRIAQKAAKIPASKSYVAKANTLADYSLDESKGPLNAPMGLNNGNNGIYRS